MDNRPSELQAEKYIESQLIKHGFIVTKPSIDQEGADLLIIQSISTKITHLIKIQCKYRNTRNSTSIEIPIKYVEENFIVFLYSVEETKNDLLYLFFAEDISNWRSDEKNFKLTIPKDFQNRDTFKARLFTKEIRSKIQNILDRQPAKTNNSILIDGIFLGKVVRQTRAIYKKVYPQRILGKPSIDDIVFQCLNYLGIQKKENVNCYLIYSSSFGLERIVDIGEFDVLNGEILSEVGCGYNLFKSKTEELICFKVEEQLKRIINVENVLLIADDYAYIPYLHELQNRGVEVTLFQNSENSGSRMYHGFKWVDIAYPLALSMGLQKDEL